MNEFIKNRFIKKSEHGFTLVELIIALALLSVLVLAVTGMLAGVPRFYRDLRSEEEGKEAVWTALNFMARELRSAKSFDAGNSTSAILIFQDENDDQISYRRSGNILERGVDGNFVPMVDNVISWEIEYHANLADPACFSQVTLNLNEESITIRPRMYQGKDAGDGWFE